MKSAGKTISPMLKKGDVVICVDNREFERELKIGKIYIVKECREYEIIVEDYSIAWRRFRFEPATELQKVLA